IGFLLQNPLADARGSVAALRIVDAWRFGFKKCRFVSNCGPRMSGPFKRRGYDQFATAHEVGGGFQTANDGSKASNFGGRWVTAKGPNSPCQKPLPRGRGSVTH